MGGAATKTKVFPFFQEIFLELGKIFLLGRAALKKHTKLCNEFFYQSTTTGVPPLQGKASLCSL